MIYHIGISRGSTYTGLGHRVPVTFSSVAVFPCTTHTDPERSIV